MKTYRNSSFSFLVGGVVCMHFVWRENLEICSTAPESTQSDDIETGIGSDSSGCERCRLASIGNNIGWPTRFRHPQKNHFLP